MSTLAAAPVTALASATWRRPAAPPTLPLALKLGLTFALILPLAGAHAARPAQLPDTLEQRLIACNACHARPAADNAFFPRIAGKPAAYLYNQLVNFRQGRRHYRPMTVMVEHLPYPYLQEIAEFYAAQPAALPAPQAAGLSAAEMARGRQLVLEGDAQRGLPACIACHGERLTGSAPAVAGLAGQPRAYLNAQLGNWRNGNRRAAAPDCMAVVARRLSASDVAAVSGWIASRPLPADLHPAAHIARPLPLACGSMPAADHVGPSSKQTDGDGP